MVDCDERQEKYLGQRRLSRGVKQQIRPLEGQGAWQFYGTGWEGQEGTLRLMVMDRGFGMLYSGTSKVACRCGGGNAIVRRRDPAS